MSATDTSAHGLVPAPSTVRPGSGTFVLTPETALDAPRELTAVAAWLRATLGPPTGCALLPPEEPGQQRLTLALDPGLGTEAYRLRVTASGVWITGGDAAGVFYGAQAFRQLLPPAVLRRAPVTGAPPTAPAVEIEDRPAYGWRGCMLDVARHFMPKAALLRFVDLLALHRLNVLHLHLTDDQGWRLEIAKYPRLTSVGGWRPATMLGSRQHGTVVGRPHGGFYTADDVREIVAYAAERFVTVVPEIDLPGHTQAVVAAYPELGLRPTEVRTGWGVSEDILDVTSPAALDFCRDVLDEVMELFPGSHVGIGGDECPGDPAARAAFLRALSEHVTAAGRTPYAWDEILEGGAVPGVTVAAWRGPKATAVAARAGHRVVACPDMSVYLDYRQSELPEEPTPVGPPLTLRDVYAFDPVPSEMEDRSLVIGAQCNVWTEHLDDPRAVDYMVFPRLCAFAEVVWTAERAPYEEFTRRLDVHTARLDALGVEYRPKEGPRPWQSRPDAPGWPITRADREAVIAGFGVGAHSSVTP
ncbi:beta-N-acetylhexosaminidase [Streptosporangium saharense]|uniref:beta-N-acetylhexosaminidase n=1 Tax=Streptosporangium saharense TaxID=1706840 RepID=A0A7W7VRE8_9ACTN|nr:beta-N-acetylhexosaminidase [Streptosporangium saharense]MBB4920026.1 hexosaminidase [Streptosporangium saharense]